MIVIFLFFGHVFHVQNITRVPCLKTATPEALRLFLPSRVPVNVHLSAAVRQREPTEAQTKANNSRNSSGL